jgi:hypothetical protein
MAVAASGFVGRYIYAQIPKSLNETAMSLDEIEKLSTSARDDLSRQRIIPKYVLERVLTTPDAARVDHMSMLGALAAMLWRDLRQPLNREPAAGHRSFGDNIRTPFRLFPSQTPSLRMSFAW